MTTCSNGLSLWKPFTKASQLFTQEEGKGRGKKKRERERQRDRLERKQKKGLEINSQKLSAKEKDDGREKKRGGFGKEEAGI